MVIIGVSSVSKCVCLGLWKEGVIRVSGEEERGPEREKRRGGSVMKITLGGARICAA